MSVLPGGLPACRSFEMLVHELAAVAGFAAHPGGNGGAWHGWHTIQSAALGGRDH